MMRAFISNEKIMRTAKFLITAALIGLAPHAMASDEASGITLTPGIGMSIFDGQRGIDKGPHVNFGLGYRFDSPWAAEINYTTIDTDTKLTNAEVEGPQWRVDSLYNLQSNSNIKPFLSFGVGTVKLGANDKETQLNIGMGVKYLFSSNSALRADLKMFRSNDQEHALDAGLTIGYQYTLGSAGRAVSMSAPRPAPTPAPMPVVDPDTDGDGVNDASDRCPNTPAGVSVDAKGCALDSDRDGVVDHRDSCPSTFPPALVDGNGCYRVLEKSVNIELNIQFDFDSSRSLAAHAIEVRKVADFMAQYPSTSVVIEGHSDSMGNDDYNQRLSETRAATIANMLVEEFRVDASRVSSIGYGESKPKASNDTEAGRQRNRRAVAVVAAILEANALP
jgi:OOP family OmpA-OmpF porin